LEEFFFLFFFPLAVVAVAELVEVAVSGGNGCSSERIFAGGASGLPSVRLICSPTLSMNPRSFSILTAAAAARPAANTATAKTKAQ
jgi:hypothetical protein